MWANIAMQRCDDSAVSMLDDSFVAPLPASPTAKSRESRLVIEKKGNLLDYSTRNLSMSGHSPTPSPNNRKRQLLQKSFAWHDTKAHLNFDLTRSDSCASLSLQDLSVPFTELLGKDEQEDDDENNESTISNLPDFSTRGNKKKKKKVPLTSHGKSQSLHNPSFERSGILNIHRSSILSVDSATSAPADMNNMTRRRTSDRKFLCKSLEQALAVRDNQKPEPVTEIKFRLKKQSRDGGKDNNNNNNNTKTGRSKSIVLMSDFSNGSHPPTKQRGSNSGVASTALQEMWKESRRETLKGILADPVMCADLNRTSLRSSFHVVAVANQKQQSCAHRESVLAKKQARLHEAFNEGFSDFTMRDISTRTHGSDRLNLNGGSSPQRSPPPSRRKTMRAQRQSMMLAPGGNINALPNLMMDESTRSAPATSAAPATSQSKAYIMEYMKELLQTAAPKPKRNVLKPKLKRASTEPAKSIGSLSIASSSVDGNQSQAECSDTSSKAAAEIVALKALVGSHKLQKLTKGTLRRATTLPNLITSPSTSSHSRRSHGGDFKIPASITVVKKLGSSCHDSVGSQMTSHSTRSAPTSRRAQRAAAASSNHRNHLKPAQMQSMMPASLVFHNGATRRESLNSSMPNLEAMPDSNPGQVESYSSLPSIPDAPEEEQEQEECEEPQLSPHRERREQSPHRRRSSFKPDQRLTRTLSSMFQDFDDSMTSVDAGRRSLLRSSSWSSRKSMSLMIQMQDISNERQNDNMDRRSSIRRKSRSFKMPSSGERRSSSVLGSNLRTLRSCAAA